MEADQALGLLNHLLWTSALVAAPLLLSCLVVGLAINVLQVTTQLQEMTLSYIPKLAVAVVVLIALGPWMIREITEFAINTIKLIPTLG